MDKPRLPAQISVPHVAADSPADESVRQRLVILGASNVVRGLPWLVETARQKWGAPLEIVVAAAHGRSYGLTTSVLGRKISSVLACRLWAELSRRPRLPTAAVVTDVGNDILYGAEMETMVGWVRTCLERLAAAGASTIVTELPLDAIERLGKWRFGVLRRVMFPFSRLTFDDALSRAAELNRRLAVLGREQNVPVIPVFSDWYGFDSIHLRRRHFPQAWDDWLAELGAPVEVIPPLKVSLTRSLYVRSLPPEERSLLGIRHHRAQPAGRLPDGTTLSLF